MDQILRLFKFHMIIAHCSSSDSRSGSWRKILRISSASKYVKLVKFTSHPSSLTYVSSALRVKHSECLPDLIVRVLLSHLPDE